MMNMRVGRGDKSFKQWMGLIWFALKFGMKLARQKKRMRRNFNQFHQFSIGSIAAENKSGLLEKFAVGVIEFVAMAMPFLNHKGAVKMVGDRTHFQLARLRAEPHGAAFFRNFFLLFLQGDDGMRRVQIKFCGVRFFQF